VDVGDANTGTTGTLNLNMGTTAATRGLSFSNNSLATNTDIEFDLIDTLNDTWLTFTDVLVPTNVITFQQRADSDPSHILKVTDGTAYGQTSHGTNAGAAQGFVIDTATNATQTNTLALWADGTGLTYDMTGNTNTDVDFDLHDTLNDTWLTFTDVAVATNVVSYEQSAESDPGFTNRVTNGTSTSTVSAEGGASPFVQFFASNGTLSTQTRHNHNGIAYTQSGNTQGRYQDQKTFTDNAKLDLALVPVGSNGGIMGTFSYGALESGGGVVIANSGVMNFACVNEADAEVCTVADPAGAALPTEVSAVDGSSGATMACTPGIDADEANAVMFHITCDTSSSAGGTAYWKLELTNINTAVVLQ